MNFKNIFLSLRTTRGFNQDEMAKALGVSKSSVAMWETGNRLPSPEVFEQIADYFNVDIDFLYGRTDIKRKVIFDEYGDEFVRADKALKILKHYTKLNDIGKYEAVRRVEELTQIPKYIDEPHLMAAHNDNPTDEQINLIKEDMTSLKRP